MADIIELVLADHDRIRRLMGALDNAARYGELGGADWVAARAWHRLADLLDVHTAAEAEIWYPAAARMGLPAAAGLREAVAGHDGIRAALRQVPQYDIASPPWWTAVAALLRACSDHLGSQEPHALSDLSRQIAPAVRITLGDQWDSFVASRVRNGLRPPAGLSLRCGPVVTMRHCAVHPGAVPVGRPDPALVRDRPGGRLHGARRPGRAARAGAPATPRQ